jgi:hypothetical protein
MKMLELFFKPSALKEVDIFILYLSFFNSIQFNSIQFKAGLEKIIAHIFIQIH